ncbi:hypothetical protein C2S51_000783 [Perilla frutescens var. frutescens]|nr:hypothetical protein C2S51_000783 [Perilla frutescens var. frutescens]
MNGVEVVASWFTPTVLFCVLNLMIGTIFITSTLKPPHSQPQSKDEQPPPQPQLVRVSSFFERVKSFNLSRYHPDDHAVPTQEETLPPQLGRVPSFFERVKSFNLSSYQHSDPDPAHHDVPAQEETQPPQLVRVPSFFERVKSFNLSRSQHSEPDPAHHAIPAQEERHHHVTRSKSDTVAKTAPAARVLQKSFSVKIQAAAQVAEVGLPFEVQGAREVRSFPT